MSCGPLREVPGGKVCAHRAGVVYSSSPLTVDIWNFNFFRHVIKSLSLLTDLVFFFFSLAHHFSKNSLILIVALHFQRRRNACRPVQQKASKGLSSLGWL